MIFFSFAALDSDFQIVEIEQTIHQWKAYLFVLMMYTSQFTNKLTLIAGFVFQGHNYKKQKHFHEWSQTFCID